MFASGHLGQKPAVGEEPAGRCVCVGEREEDGAFLSLDGAENVEKCHCAWVLILFFNKAFKF